MAIKCGRIILASVYISPNVDIGTYRGFLDELDDLIALFNGGGLVLCGDFNSHATMWGSNNTDARGLLLENWAADLRLINSETAPMYICPQGDSIIDINWVTADLIRYVTGWCIR